MPIQMHLSQICAATRVLEKSFSFDVTVKIILRWSILSHYCQLTKYIRYICCRFQVQVKQ